MPPASGKKGIKARLSQYGLPLALSAILAFSGLSFIALGMLKRSEPEPPPPDVENKVTAQVTPPAEEKKPAFPPPPKPIASDPQGTLSAFNINQPQSPADSAAPTEPTPPSTSDQPPTAPAGGQNDPLNQTSGAVQPPGEQTPRQPIDQPPTRAAAPQTAAREAPATAPGQAPGLQPSQLPPPDQMQAQAQPPAQPDQPPADNVDQVDGLNKPVWQVYDEKWDQVDTTDAGRTDAAPAGAAWRQINVGQADEVGQEPAEEPAPEPDAEKAEKEPETDQPKTESAKPPTTKRPRKKTVRRQPPRPKPKRPAPSAVRLAVINESGLAGQAQVYANVLSAMGYNVAHTEDRAPQSGPTFILYTKGNKSKAAALYKNIPGDRTMAPLDGPAPHDIVILVR